MAKKTLLSDTPKNILASYRQRLQAAGVRVDKMILFGSYARGKQRWDSDMDVCVVSRDFGEQRLKDRMRLAAIAVEVDSMIESHPMTPDDLEDPYSTLSQEITKYGQVV